MSVPVAGRRKGQATTSSSSTIPPTTTPVQNVPSWLDDPGPDTAASAASPFTLVGSSSMPAQLPSLTVYSGAPLAVTSASPATAGLPAFLLDDEQPQPQTVSPLSATTATVPQASAAAAEAERQRKRELEAELAALTQQLAKATRHVEVLHGEAHPAATEVKELEAALVALRAKEADAQKQKAERDARVQQEAQAEATSAQARATTDATISAYRAECTQRYEQELTALHLACREQESTNAALRKDCEAAMSTTTESRCQTAAFDALQQRLQDGVRQLKQHFSQQCSSTVALSARTFLDAAQRQRSDIFARDTARRVEQLQSYHAEREKSAAEFRDECHTVFQGRADALFGVLKTSFEKQRRLAEGERSQRLSAFNARLRAMTERGRVLMDQQLRARVEREHALTVAQNESASKELASRRNELAQQRRLFQSRAEAEYQSLCETRGAAAHTSISGAAKSSFSPSKLPASAAAAPSLASLHRDMEAMRTKLNQTCLTIHARQQRLHASSPFSSPLSQDGQTRHSTGVFFPPPMPSPVSRLPGKSQLSFERATSLWQDAILSLQQRREQLRRTIAELTATTQSWSSSFQRGRRQLAERREAVGLVRRDWEARIRSQLSTCLTVQNAEVPVLASLSTLTLEDLQRRVAGLVTKQEMLRSTRSAFATQMSDWVQSTSNYRSHVEQLLNDVFCNFEVLRQTSVQVEVDELALRSTQAQLQLLHRHVSEEAHRLAVQKRQLDAFVKELRAGRTVTLPSFLTSSDHLSQGHSTQIFSSSASPLLDITNASFQRMNCDPAQIGEAEEIHVPQKADAAKTVTQPPKHASSATTRSLTVTAGDDGSDRRHSTSNAPRPQRASDRAVTTTTSTSSGADFFGNASSPSPIMPSLDEKNGGGGLASGAYISVSPQIEDARERMERLRRSVDTDPGFTTNLEPLDDLNGDDDDDDSMSAPL